MGTSARGKNKLPGVRAPELHSKKRHSHCDLSTQREDTSRPQEERDLRFFAVATPAWVSGGTYFAMRSLRSASCSRRVRVSIPGVDSSSERHFIVAGGESEPTTDSPGDYPTWMCQ